MVFDIQRFSLHDGPGIRTTVFLKGCPLHCAWCHNPESMGGSVQIAYDASLCIGCGACVSACSAGAHTCVGGSHVFCRERCVACGACAAVCPALALEKAGREMRVEEVLRVVEQDKPFYRDSGGGLTVSGGEPLAQAAFTAALLQGARAAGIQTAVETSGAGSEADVRAVADVCDLVLFDLKAAPSAYPNLVGCDFERVEASLRIFAAGGNPVRLRLPLVPGVNDTDEHFAHVAKLVRRYPSIEAVDILPYHRLGAGKYARFGMPPPATEYKAPNGAVRDRWRVKLAEANK